MAIGALVVDEVFLIALLAVELMEADVNHRGAGGHRHGLKGEPSVDVLVVVGGRGPAIQSVEQHEAVVAGHTVGATHVGTDKTIVSIDKGIVIIDGDRVAQLCTVVETLPLRSQVQVGVGVGIESGVVNHVGRGENTGGDRLGRGKGVGLEDRGILCLMIEDGSLVIDPGFGGGSVLGQTHLRTIHHRTDLGDLREGTRSAQGETRNQ